MSIIVAGRRMTVTNALKEYAEEKIGGAMKVMDISPLVAEVVLSVEKNPANPRPCCCEVTLRTKGHTIRVEEHEEDMYAAVDVASAKVVRQMRKYKTRVIDAKVRDGEKRAAANRAEAIANEEIDFDALIAEFSEQDQEIVRVKEVAFAPMTQEEALIEIDLLGHDFFAYVDRDTNLVNVLYRRNDGGYGLLKQVER